MILAKKHVLTLHSFFRVRVTAGPRQALVSVKMESGQVTSPAKPSFSPVPAQNMRTCAPPSTADKRLCSFIEGIAEKAAVALTVVTACREAQRTLTCMERETAETIMPALSERAIRFAWPRAWKTDGVTGKATGVCMDGSRVFAGETGQLLTSLMEAVKETDEVETHVRLLKAAADGSGKAVSVHVCVCVYMCTNTICVYTYADSLQNIHPYMHIHEYPVYTPIYSLYYLCIHTYIHTCVCVHTYIHTYIHIYIYIYIYI
jgi:hypothetical protein